MQKGRADARPYSFGGSSKLQSIMIAQAEEIVLPRQSVMPARVAGVRGTRNISTWMAGSGPAMTVCG